MSSARDGAPFGSPGRPSRGGTELLLKTSRERSLCSIRSAPNPYLVAMFLKGGEVHVSCDVLATEVIEDLLPRGVLPPGREVAARRPVELPSAKSAVVPKNRSRSDGDALLAELDRWKTRRRQARASPVAKARGRNGSGRARGCGFNRHVTPGEDGFGHFAVARLTRPRSHPPGTPSCSRATGRAAAKSPPKQWLDLFGGDGGAASRPRHRSRG